MKGRKHTPSKARARRSRTQRTVGLRSRGQAENERYTIWGGVLVGVHHAHESDVLFTTYDLSITHSRVGIRGVVFRMTSRW